MEQHLLEAVSDGVATLTLNRPERLNALSTPIMDGLLEALPRLARDSAVGSIVLTGAGRAFCTGGDVKSMAEGRVERSMEEAVIHLRGSMEVSRLLHEIPKPTIARVNGPAAGAGMSLALACDLRIAGQSARFVTAFANIGFPATSAAATSCPSLSAPVRRVNFTIRLSRSMRRRPYHWAWSIGSSRTLISPSLPCNSRRNWQTDHASPLP
jgi:2-(1,2-epoxy-1,2-dihydrophenyl)acetyl-CoA isomerase